MKPAPVAYAAPRYLADALELIETHADGAKALAGGQSLVPLLNMRLARPSLLVDLNRIPELAGVRREDTRYVIGAMTRQRTAENHPDLARDLLILREALGWVGHIQIRNRGTIGGSLAHADPSAELPLLAVLLDIELRLESRSGARVVPAREFFLSYLTTSLAPTELLTEVFVPIPRMGAGWAFGEVARRHGDFALVAAGVMLQLDLAGRIDQVQIAVGGAHPVPVRFETAEASLHGHAPEAGVFAEVAEIGARALEPEADVHASAGYRRRVAARLVHDLLGQALARARTSQ